MPDPLANEFLHLQEVLAGRFFLEHELGRGGMGVVLLARDVALDRPVAIKLLPASLAADDATRARFLREARTAAGLSHPNIVPIHLVEEHEALVFFVMGYVDGETLREHVERHGTLSPKQAASVFQQVAWALGYAHQRGVIHRDVKPDNIMIERDSGRAIVMDFGIAHTDRYASDASEVIGTARYMSPEQSGGEPVEARSDLYALGATAFYALTGRAPFEAGNVPALLAKHITEKAPGLRTVRADVPSALADVVDTCLAKRPDDRPASGDELANRLDVSRGHQLRAPPLIRSFVRNAQVTTMILATIAVAGTDVFSISSSGGFNINGLPIFISITLIGQLVGVARRLLSEGFTFEDIRAALTAEATAQAEEADLMGQKGWLRRVDSMWSRLWAGKFGRWFFKVAGAGKRAPAHRALPSTDRTELLLGRATEQLYAGLPDAMRRQTRDLSAVMDTLERRAERLRARADGGPALTDTIAAMENVRIALLRLQAGSGSADDLTQALARARAIGTAVDGRLEG